ncbi:hypothetical protein EJ05DRAFT_48130 [Pseudovirgaria hyperparasitica]|uniref:Uncharacterized protein n=1 Tax=Pseudovirgaria hyperparasitica TaxID=470096 RepID=A0A6A6W2Y8_9PEZI|nr:uncharacterized protein EJ05DRAFT_48130 [Pseudovirgaria hyperparasitica]KAF2756925.1 hypothetical protein EJ05DRAFT_48130 [Pseudovirgaria hyperparasitica]
MRCGVAGVIQGAIRCVIGLLVCYAICVHLLGFYVVLFGADAGREQAERLEGGWRDRYMVRDARCTLRDGHDGHDGLDDLGRGAWRVRAWVSERVGLWRRVYCDPEGHGMVRLGIY